MRAANQSSNASSAPCRCLPPRADGADWMRRLRDAALMDENGIALDGALKTIATL